MTEVSKPIINLDGLADACYEFQKCVNFPEQNRSRNPLVGASQLDIALRRQFDLTERWHLQFRADAFNLFNQANFANPNGVLTSASFGRATQMLSNGLGGLSPLFQSGGPRSLQLALKLQF